MFGPGGQIDHLSFAGSRGGGKGGGTGAFGPQQVAPSFTDPTNGMSFDTTDALNAEIQQRLATEKAASDAAQAATLARTGGTDPTTGRPITGTDETAFQHRLADARAQGTTNVNNYFQSQGLDPNKYASQITPFLDTATKSVADLDPNPMSAFPTTLGATILNQLQSGKQAQASSAVSGAFGPTFAQDNLPLTATQPAINDILNSQFDPLSAQLTNAQKRGTLNSTGYAAALKAMSDKRTAATSTLNSLASGIINNDRSSLGSYISGAKNDAAGVTLNNADSFDPSKYTGEAQSMIANDISKLPGDLNNAVGSTSFADLPSLLNAGGSVQGANDPTAANPNGAVGPNGAPIGPGGVSPSYIADQVLANTKRGLGTSGAF